MQRAIAAPMFPRPINAAFIFAPCSRLESHIYDLPTPKNSIDDNSHSYLPMRPTTFCSQLASYILGDFAQCPLYPQKRTLHCTAANVRFVPKADKVRRSKMALFDHLVGAGEQCRWHSEAECLCCLE